MKSCLDKSFRYVPSFETDVRKTFARIQRERRLAAEQAAKEAAAMRARYPAKIVEQPAPRVTLKAAK